MDRYKNLFKTRFANSFDFSSFSLFRRKRKGGKNNQLSYISDLIHRFSPKIRLITSKIFLNFTKSSKKKKYATKCLCPKLDINDLKLNGNC